MRKIITRHLCIYMLVAIAVTVLFIFSLQTVLNQRDNTQSSYDKLAMVEEKLQGNDEQIQKLEDSLSENALAKARAFAAMLELDPTLMESASRMEETMQILDVSELHVIDEKGIITHSTISAYVGFDMGSGEQSAAFLRIIDDPTYELAQEPQPNAAMGVMVQYVGVTRTDAKGLVQVGIQPEVLDEMLAATSVDVVLSAYDFGEDGYIFAINKDDNTIAAHGNLELVGMDATEAGFPANLGAGQGTAVVDGVKGYYVTEEYGDMIIGTMLPSSEYYEVRGNQTVVVSASMLVIFLILLFMINRLVNVKIVTGIHKITDGLQVITKGNLDQTVEVNDNPEFQFLSDSINQMVDSIRSNMKENEKLLEQQREDVENNRKLVRQVKEICRNVEEVSQATLGSSKSIHMGAEDQKQEVELLNATMDELSKQLQESAATSKNIADTTIASVDRMMLAKNNMEQLKEAIQDMADTSVQIEKIIDEIQSIATQTNMLSLNASIEAARAGEMGRGFAVVATQVGDLADRSAKAAQETTGLITKTIQMVNRGKELADVVVNDFLNVADDMQDEGDKVEAIAETARQQANMLMDAMAGLERIASVVDNNVAVSEESEQTSENLTEETAKLYRLVDSSV